MKPNKHDGSIAALPAPARRILLPLSMQLNYDCFHDTIFDSRIDVLWADCRARM